MVRLRTSTLAISSLLSAAAPIAAMSQSSDQAGAPQQQIERRDPDNCGAAGAGCDPKAVQQWKAVGIKLADLSSADLSQYAYACAQHPEWEKACRTDPTIILKRLSIEGY